MKKSREDEQTERTGLGLHKAMQLFGILISACCLLSLTATPAICDGGGFVYHGTFSSMYYHEEAGDLLGVEIKIVHVDNKGYQGVLQFGEGDAGELILFWPEIDGNSISFSYKSKTKSGHFIGIYTDYGIQPKDMEKASWWNLKRQPSYWDEYRNEHNAPTP